MSKGSVAPPNAAPQAASRTIPLAGVSLSWEERNAFTGEKGWYTIAGNQLAMALHELSHVAKKGDKHLDAHARLGDAQLSIQGVSEILYALSQVDLGMINADPAAIHYALGDYLRLTVNGMHGWTDREPILKSATLSVGASSDVPTEGA